MNFNGNEKSSSMKDSYLERYVSHPSSAKKSVPEAAEEEALCDDLGAFGILRGARDKALMLELIQRDGTITALAYAWLERVLFDPSEGMTLHFGRSIARITGRNLRQPIRPHVRLFDFLVRHRVPWIKEADESTKLSARSDTVVIETITIEW